LDFKRILGFLFDIKDGLTNGELWGRGVQNLIRFAIIFIPLHWRLQRFILIKTR
jgi:hypothetical protein